VKHYLEQLVDDIHKATLKVTPPHPLWLESGADPDDEVELEDMLYAEKFMYGDEKPISDITGIDAAALPPPEKLTGEQQAMLAVELEKLLQFFHFYLDFPETYPVHMRYPFIRDIWSESFVPISFGEDHIEFCDYEEEKCPFPGYCSICKDIAEDMKHDEECAKGKDFNFDIDVNNLLPTPEEVEKWAKENGIDSEEESDLDDIFGPSEDYDPASDFVGGFFNDDGTPFDPDSVPVPGLCIICKNYQNDDPEENFLCMMNRNDQRDKPDFQCGSFEKI
jgi:hypothetical protein